VVNILSGPNETTTDPDAEIAFEVIEPRTGRRAPFAVKTFVTCRIDGGRERPCSSPVRYGDLDIGEHEVVVSAWSFGRACPSGRWICRTSASYDWTVVEGAQAADPGAVVGGATAERESSTSVPTRAQRGVLAFTGTYLTQMALIGLALIAVGAVLGSAAFVTRRRSD
jgi:hypothetical protein